EGGRVVPVETEEVPDPLFPKDAPDSRDALRGLLGGVILPEFTMRSEHITRGIAQIQAAITASHAPTNRVRIGIDLKQIEEIAKGMPPPMESSDPFFMPIMHTPDMGAITSVPSLSMRFVSANDALRMLADVTGLETLFDGTEKVELVAYATYTQRLTSVRTYQLPKQFGQRVPDKEWIAAVLDVKLPPYCSVESYSAATGELAIRSAEGTFNNVGSLLADVYELFSGRFTLENKTLLSKPELVLTDTCRGIVRRYRSGIGKDGKRWERFEVLR
ncbi:MAG: hypothetical protein WCK89_24195, partial [bacterium]